MASGREKPEIEVGAARGEERERWGTGVGRYAFKFSHSSALLCCQCGACLAGPMFSFGLHEAVPHVVLIDLVD